MFARKRASLLACLVAVTFLCCAAQSGQNAQTAGTEKTLQTSERTGQTTTGQPVSDQSTNAGDALTDDQKPAANNPSERERKVAADKARLLKLAKELKEEIDKSGSGTLSLNVIRKADEIEKLAHNVKQEMNRNPKPAN